MRVILLGPPGAGKGTQAEIITRAENIPHISTGNILRAAVREGTPLGKLAEPIMARGDLVPDDIIIGIVKERLAQPDCRQGFIFDGFPRTTAQADALGAALDDLGLPLQAVVNIDVPDEVLLERVTGRRTCRNCQATYHIKFNPIRVPGVCDRCGGPLYQRDDETEAVQRNRLAVYRTNTAPLIDYYGGKGLLQTVDGNQPVEAVTQAVYRAVRGQ